MKKTTLKISGMHCASCATILTKALQKVDGVKSAQVNYGTEKATVEHDEKAKLEQLISAVKNKGYTANLDDGKTEDGDKKREAELDKQKFLLIIGFLFSIP